MSTPTTPSPSSPKNIWILTQNEHFAKHCQNDLAGQYNCQIFTAEQALAVTSELPQLIVLEIKSALHPALVAVKQAKEEAWSAVPVLVIAPTEEMATVKSRFEQGDAVFLDRSYTKLELENYVKRLLQATPAVRTNQITIDRKQIHNLTYKQVKLLNLFLATDKREISREQILKEIWQETYIHPKTIDVHLYNLRRKIHPYGYIIRSEGGGKWSLIRDRMDLPADA